GHGKTSPQQNRNRRTTMSQRYYAPWWNAKGVNNNECYADITASFEVAPDKGKKSASTATLGQWSYVKLQAGTKGTVSLKLSIGYQRTDTVMIFGKPERALKLSNSLLRPTMELTARKKVEAAPGGQPYPE